MMNHSLVRFWACLSVLAAASLPAMGATWNPDPALGNPQQHRHLYDIARRYCDRNFDPQADLVGAFSHYPPNRKWHDVRESTYYVYGLMLTGDASDLARAQAILRRVLAAQDTRVGSPTCGAFKWYAEDAKPNDLNAAAFDGLSLADVLDLDQHHPVLAPALRQEVEKAVRLAVEAVMRRNVDPGYTNIAMISAALAAAGQKMLAIPGAGAFAQAKLDAVMKLADDGDFAEYQSPTYTAVDLGGAYLARKFAFSPAFKATAQAAIDHLWKMVAASYHAPTCQLGGPYLRAYGDNMLEYAAGLKYWLYLALYGNYPLPDTDIDHDWDKAGLFELANLAVTPRPEFKNQPAVAWRQWTAVGSGSTPVRHLSQYRDGNFILGTVAFQDEWQQKRNLVAYWRNQGSGPGGFQVGMCIDESNETLPGGFPGVKLHFYCDQVKDAALVALTASTDIPGFGGVSTLVFNRSAKGVKRQGDGCLQIEDGSVTTYLYPVANSPVTYQMHTDARTFRVTRPWSTADAVGPLRVLAYLVVFRPADQPAPVVSGIVLHAVAKGITAAAKVDGKDLSVTFTN